MILKTYQVQEQTKIELGTLKKFTKKNGRININIQTKKHNLKIIFEKKNWMVDPSSWFPNLHKLGEGSTKNTTITIKVEYQTKQLNTNVRNN